MCVYISTWVEVRGQLARDSSLLIPCRFQELNGSLGLAASALNYYAILPACSVFGSISFLILKVRTGRASRIADRGGCAAASVLLAL